MRYTLYEATADLIPLEKEIEYLKNYVELEMLRIKNKKFVKLKISGNSKGFEIAPMLLITFVENAFKHCNRESISPGIKIELKFIGKELILDVINKTNLVKEEDTKESGGLGLENVKKRLEIQYAGKHELKIISTDSEYKTQLKIQLL